MGVKISELTAAGELDGTEVFPIVQSGSTVKTNIEAGEELGFNTNTQSIFGGWSAIKLSNDSINCVVLWPEIPKQGTSISITFPATSLLFRDGAASNGIVTSGGHTISNFEIQGKHVIFRINETGVFASLNDGPLFVRILGTGCKLTIT